VTALGSLERLPAFGRPFGDVPDQTPGSSEAVQCFAATVQPRNKKLSRVYAKLLKLVL